MNLTRFQCSFSGCEAAASRSPGAGCDECHRYLCSTHMLPEYHFTCFPDAIWDIEHYMLKSEEIGRLRAKLNDRVVCELASQLNDEKPCTIEFPSAITRTPRGPRVGADLMMGRRNYHARIRFENDPQSWLMRIPRITGYACALPVSLANYFIRSEYATLKFLNTTSIPVPRVFSFGTTDGPNSRIGVPFLLMEELPGHTWDGESHQEKIWKSLAEVYAQLAKHSFPMIGSLIVESPEEKPSIGALASDRFDRIDPYGPFESSKEYYTAWAEQYLDLIAKGQLYHQFPVEAYLIYRFLQEQAADLSEPEQDGQFFLRHVDDKGDHILVDEEGNITGIIDWSMARVVPREEAFALSFVSAEMNVLCSENASLSLSDKDKAFRAALLEEGLEREIGAPDEKMRRFFWGLAMETEWKYALPEAKGILRAFGVEQGWEAWKEEAMRRWKGDQRLARLARNVKSVSSVT